MSEPVWISESVILAIQMSMLARFGGLEGVRDPGMLDSALHRPRQQYAYGETDLCVLAATYAGGIVRNHPFLDGNKRAGFMAAYVFLGANGEGFQAPELEVAERTLALAAGAIGEAEYALWLRESCVPKREI